MSANYSIAVDPARNLVRIRLSGFFGDADIAGFLAERHAAHAQLTSAPNEHCTITDVREMKIQSQDMVQAFHTMLADPTYRSRKLAFVAAPTLARTQLIRAIGQRGAETFDTHEAAEAWIFAGTASRAAA